MRSAVGPVPETDTTVASQSSYMKVFAYGGSFKDVCGELIGMGQNRPVQRPLLSLTFCGKRFATLLILTFAAILSRSTSVWCPPGFSTESHLIHFVRSASLKLNNEKNRASAIGDRIRLSLVRKERLPVGSSSVPFKTSAKYLGVHLDVTLSMNEQISSLCRSSYFHLRKIGLH